MSIHHHRSPRRDHEAAARPPLRIGLSARVMHSSPHELGFKGKPLQYLESSIAHWIMEHGALAVMVPVIDASAPGEGRRVAVRDYVAQLDGLVLQGGADVAPQTYGREPLQPQWAGDAIRDRYELALLHEFIHQGKPVVGVCRGAQLLNVYFGGTLYQDLLTQRPGTHRHVDAELHDELVHEITFTPGSRLAGLYKDIGRSMRSAKAWRSRPRRRWTASSRPSAGPARVTRAACSGTPSSTPGATTCSAARR
jgi:gamma-glutamyl-gamma-aminobutyrate hydrolase PuuD